MSGLRERKREETLKAIKKVAWHLFRGRGFDRTTVRAVAEGAGVSVGTIFNYAEDKDDLLLMIFEDKVGPVMREAIASLPPGPTLDRLVHLFGALQAVYAREPDLGQIVIRNMFFVQGKARDRRQALDGELLTALHGLLLEGQAAGELRADLPLALAAQALFGDHVMVLVAALSGEWPEVGDRREVLRHVLRLRLEGLAAPGAGAPGEATQQGG